MLRRCPPARHVATAFLDRAPRSAIRVAMDLVEVRFAPQDRFVLVAPGTTLLAAADLAGVELLTGCRRGQCGTDAVHVEVSRPDALEPAGDPEAGTLARMGVGPDCRLACSARVRCGRVLVLGDAIDAGHPPRHLGSSGP